MSRDRHERGHVSQRYPYETLPMPHATPMPPIPPLPKQYRAAWPTDTPPSILSLTTPTALPSSLSPSTIHNFPGPCHKYLDPNVNVKPAKAVLCTRVTPSIPASTSTYQAQRDIALVNVNNDICKTSPSACRSGFGASLGRDEDIDKRDMDNVKAKRAPQIISESVSSSAEPASYGSSPTLSQSSPARASVTGSSTSPVSSSILTNTFPVPGTSTPHTFTSTAPTVTSFTTTTTFPLTSSAPASPTTPSNGVTSSKPPLTPLPTTTGTTTMSNLPDPRSSSSTTTARVGPSSATSILVSLPTITFPTTSSFTTSISGIPTSLTAPPSASISSSSIITSDSATITVITSFTSSSSTFTSSFTTITFTPSSSNSPSSSDSDSTSFKSSTSPSWLTQSSTYTSRPSMIISSSTTNRVWSTATSTKVYTSTLPNGSATVVTTVVQSGVLSTNTSLSGNRFSTNTGAVIAVAVCATAGVIIFVFVLFFLCKRYRERKERQKRRKIRRPGLRLPAVAVSRPPGTGNSGSSGGVGGSSANILGTRYRGEWSRSRSGEAVMEGGEAGPSEDGEDEEDVWRSPLVGEDDDVVMGMGGVATPPESGEGRGKSSIGHQSGHSHSLGHSLAHSQSSSAHHGQGQGVPPPMAEFGMGPVSYAAYAYPPALVGYPGVTAGGGGEEGGVPGGGEGQSRGLDSHGSRASYGAFVPYGPNPFMPYPSPVALSGVGTGCHVPPATNVVDTEDKPGQRPGSGRRESEGEVPFAAGGHATAVSASATAATTAGASGLVSMPTTGTTGSRGTSGSKGSLRSIGSKNLRGFMDRIRTSVPNIQVTDGMLPTGRSSRDMSSPTSASGSGGETRPGYDYGAVGRPRVVSGGIHAPPPVAFVYPGFHITPPGAPETDVPSDLPQIDISNHHDGPVSYGYPVPTINGDVEAGVDEDEDDSLRIMSGVVTDGLLEPNLSLGGVGGDGGSVGGRSSPNVEGASLRDYVDYSRRIGGMVKNHITRSTTTFETVDQDGSIHFFANDGGTPTPG